MCHILKEKHIFLGNMKKTWSDKKNQPRCGKNIWGEKNACLRQKKKMFAAEKAVAFWILDFQRWSSLVRTHFFFFRPTPSRLSPGRTREAPTASPKSMPILGAKNEPSGHSKVLLREQQKDQQMWKHFPCTLPNFEACKRATFSA